MDPTTSRYARCIRPFQAVCARVQHIPASYELTDVEVEDRDKPLHQTNYSDIFLGTRGSTQVALKSMRLHKDDVAKVLNVSIR
jgi:hypothetical protein